MYKENYKLKKKMVSLVSLELWWVFMILLQCEMDHTGVNGGVTEVKHHFSLLGWNSDYPAKTSAQYLCSNKYFLLFSKQHHLLCEPQH